MTHAEHEHTEDHAHVVEQAGHDHSGHAVIGSEDFWPDFWSDFWSLMGDPAHWLFEIVNSAVLYLIFGVLLWRFVIQSHLLPRLNTNVSKKLEDLHEELDREHGVTHEDKTEPASKP